MKKLFTRVLAGALGVSMLFSGSVFAVDEDAVKAPRPTSTPWHTKRFTAS